MDVIALYNGQVMQVHPERQCLPPCPIHAPSEHVLSTAPLLWRDDRSMFERVCPHGTGHPDPDDLAYKRLTMLPEVYRMHAYEIHGCDGCCETTVSA